jgi:hypothetical protein
MGGTLGVANKLYQAAAAVANWETQAHTVALAVGDTEISFTDGGTSFTANQLAGGTIIVEETDDLGHVYRVKSNVATAANETVCQLEDGVTVQKEVAVAGANVLTARLNPWREIILSVAATLTGMPVGIPRIVIAASAWGWTQTRGQASCVLDAGTAILVGDGVRASEDDNGGVCLRDETAAKVDRADVGVAMDTAPDLDFGLIFLQIE